MSDFVSPVFLNLVFLLKKKPTVLEGSFLSQGAEILQVFLLERIRGCYSSLVLACRSLFVLIMNDYFSEDRIFALQYKML